MKNAINWFEIPVTNFDRALAFYETILGNKMQPMEAMQMRSAFFPADLEQGAIGGCIIQGAGYEPSKVGTTSYLNGGDDLENVLSKVEAAGGKIIIPKTNIGEHGFMAQFIDTEGNKVGLHSRN